MRPVLRVCLGLALLWAGHAQAAGSANASPAATLLLPYFEIDQVANYPDDPADEATQPLQNTYVTFGNITAESVLTRVTLWTDYGVPSLWFNVYLAGYDIERLDLRSLFDGVMPRTGPTASHYGPVSIKNVTFPNCGGDFGERFPAPLIDGLRKAHLGEASPLFGNQCGSHAHGDNRLRGYLTIDVIDSCSLHAPHDPNYILTLSKGAQANRLWGHWETFDRPGNAATAGTLVHIESSDNPIPGDQDFSFYRRFAAPGADRREALGSVWAQRYMRAGFYNGDAELTVWREPRAAPTPVACGGGLPAYLPLTQDAVIAFDEMENPANLAPAGIGLGLVAQRITLDGPELPLPFGFGWLYLNLNYGSASPAERAQSYVSGSKSAPDRVQVGTDGIMLAHPAGTGVNAGPGAGVPRQ